MLPLPSVDNREFSAVAVYVSVFANVFVPLHVLLLVVPNASENVLSDVKSPPPSSGYVVLMFLADEAGVNPKIEDEAAVLSVPLLFDVYTIPLDVRFERVVMFCVVLTLN